MGSRSINVKTSEADTFVKIQQRIGTSGFNTKSIVANQSIIAEGGRDFKMLWMVIFIIFVWPAAIIYYFTRDLNSVSVTITTSGEVGCKVTIMSNGIKGDKVMESIAEILQ